MYSKYLFLSVTLLVVFISSCKKEDQGLKKEESPYYIKVDFDGVTTKFARNMIVEPGILGDDSWVIAGFTGRLSDSIYMHSIPMQDTYSDYINFNFGTPDRKPMPGTYGNQPDITKWCGLEILKFESLNYIWPKYKNYAFPNCILKITAINESEGTIDGTFSGIGGAQGDAVETVLTNGSFHLKLP